MLAELRVVDGIALQRADQHGRAFLRVVTHAGLLAQNLGGADAGAAAAEDIRRENLLGRALNVLVADIADERGDVDLAGAGIHAGCVVAIQAASAFQCGLAGGERWGQIAETIGQFGRPGIRSRQMAEGVYHGYCLTVL